MSYWVVDGETILCRIFSRVGQWDNTMGASQRSGRKCHSRVFLFFGFRSDPWSAPIVLPFPPMPSLWVRMFLTVVIVIDFGFGPRPFSSYAFILYLGGCRLQKKGFPKTKLKNKFCKGQQKWFFHPQQVASVQVVAQGPACLSAFPFSHSGNDGSLN